MFRRILVAFDGSPHAHGAPAEVPVNLGGSQEPPAQDYQRMLAVSRRRGGDRVMAGPQFPAALRVPA
jgi:hypothetical protein